MVIQLTLTYKRRTEKAIGWLLLWAIATLILYGCHYFYFNHYSILMPFSDTVYVTVNLMVYPLFLLYISAITDRKPLAQQSSFLWSAFTPPLLAGVIVGSLYATMDAHEAKAFITNYLYRGYESSLTGLALIQAWAHIVCHIIFAIQVAIVIALSWVGMHQDFTIQDIPEEQEKETNDNNKNIAVTPSNQSIQIYEKLESMMNEQQTYLKNDLLLNDVAKLLGTNRTYLLSALNSCAHMTFKEYINRKRIAHAEQLMAQYPLTPKTEIATLSGYNSMSSFYRNYGLYHS